jgi:hypothetical protein
MLLLACEKLFTIGFRRGPRLASNRQGRAVNRCCGAIRDRFCGSCLSCHSNIVVQFKSAEGDPMLGFESRDALLRSPAVFKLSMLTYSQGPYRDGTYRQGRSSEGLKAWTDKNRG